MSETECSFVEQSVGVEQGVHGVCVCVCVCVCGHVYKVCSVCVCVGMCTRCAVCACVWACVQGVQCVRVYKHYNYNNII